MEFSCNSAFFVAVGRRLMGKIGKRAFAPSFLVKIAFIGVFCPFCVDKCGSKLSRLKIVSQIRRTNVRILKTECGSKNWTFGGCKV